MEPRTYKVTKIDGDYAHLLNVDTGEDLLMARALLPDETLSLIVGKNSA